MSSKRSVETVWCPTCRTNVVAMIERYVKGTTMGICPWCGAIIHPPTKALK